MSYGRVSMRQQRIRADALNELEDLLLRAVHALRLSSSGTYKTGADVKAGNALVFADASKTTVVPLAKHPEIGQEVAGVALHDANANAVVTLEADGTWSYVEAFEPSPPNRWAAFTDDELACIARACVAVNEAVEDQVFREIQAEQQRRAQ